MERLKNENLYGWIFTYNPYKSEWLAATRDNYALLFSDSGSKELLRSSRIETLVEIISKTNGDINKLKNLVYEH